MVSASPLTRSSYHAAEDFAKLKAARTRSATELIRVRHRTATAFIH